MRTISHKLIVFVILFISSSLFAQVTVDFEAGLPAGWFVGSTPGIGSGNFVFGDPIGTTWQLEDDHTPGGTICAYSATNPSGDNGINDIDNGLIQIQSVSYPVTQLSRMSVWYFFGQATTGNDAGDLFILDYSLDGGANYQTLVFIGDVRTFPNWTEATLDIPAGSDFIIRMRAQDGGATGDFIETGMDDFSITPYTNTVTVSNPTVNEAAGTMTFTATYNGGNIGPFTVDYATTDNTAFAPGDYTAQSGTLNFSGTPGQSISRTIPITNDVYGEPTETFFFNLSNVSNTSVGLQSGTGTITDDGDTPVPFNVPLTLFDEFNGYYDYALTGDSFRDDASDECSVVTSKPGVALTTAIPAGATIDKAYLFWAHSDGNPDDTVTFEGQTVTADIVNQSSFGSATVFGMISDVTSIIQGISNPSTNLYDVTDLRINNNNPFCSSTVVLGGWSLMIFYTEPSLPAVSINFYRGFDGQRLDTTSYTLSGFFAIGSTGSKTSVLSWEGDVSITNSESLTISNGLGTATNVELVGDGDNDGTILDNPFNSTIYDDTVLPNVDRTTLGLDLDTYDISTYIATSETSVTTTVNVGNDFVALNAVLLKVPSNLITGTVFEDINYPGGAGRDITASSGVGIPNATVELFDATGTFVESTTTDANGDYVIGGMANGVYSIRIVNGTVESTRGGGAGCAGTCLPVQTFRRNYLAGTLSDVPNEVGGADPTATDVGIETLIGAQSVSSISITNEGVVDLDFGFNFNTIVNTNTDGQGSIEQFIINSNNLDETGLNIEANGIFDPAAGEDTSIFMIPPDGDTLGRTTDPGYIVADGYFDILLSGDLPDISSNNTIVDGRTQTAYSGDTNTGTIGSGGTTVGTNATTLPDYNLPEIQVRKNNGSGYSFQIAANNVTIRNLAVYGNNNSYDGIRIASGTGVSVLENIVGVNAAGIDPGTNDRHGIRVNGGQSTINGNYIASLRNNGVRINGGAVSCLIQNNHFNGNGVAECDSNIEAQGGATGVTIQDNLIENGGTFGIDNNNSVAMNILQNTILSTGSLSTGCADQIGIRILQGNTTITGNVIANNGRTGIYIGGSSLGNLISQNSIYANGTTDPSLGIDIFDNGVTRNDLNDTDSGPNNIYNFPVFESASISGTNLKLVGWSRPGAIIEVFISDIGAGTASVGDNQIGTGITQDYGEGQVYLGTITEGSGADLDTTSSSYTDIDGNTDTTNRFNITLSLTTTIPVGSLLTATATEPGTNSTSEFGNLFTVKNVTVVTNRRITYRVKAPVSSGPTGTPTTRIALDNFDDTGVFDVVLRNTTASPINYEFVIENAPYSTIPNLNPGDHTLSTIDNGDGTYTHIFTSTTPLAPFENNRRIRGDAPSPPGTDTACGCISFYEI